VRRGDAARVALVRQIHRCWGILSSSALGHGRVFEARLAGALARLERDPRARSLAFEHAERYFGPDLIISVDPAALEWQLQDTVLDGARLLRLGHRFLDAGCWAEAREMLARTATEREMEALFDEATPLGRSRAYRRMHRRAAAGEATRRNFVRLDTPPLLDAYFEHYRRLRDSIREHGLLRREELPAESRARFRDSPVRVRWSEWLEREISVAIGPGGEILRFLGGRHRTAIARRLGLPSIPVQVRLVHTRWLRACVETFGLPPHLALRAGLGGLSGNRGPCAVPGEARFG
jgi:hypothetical protein